MLRDRLPSPFLSFQWEHTLPPATAHQLATWNLGSRLGWASLAQLSLQSQVPQSLEPSSWPGDRWGWFYCWPVGGVLFSEDGTAWARLILTASWAGHILSNVSIEQKLQKWIAEEQYTWYSLSGILYITCVFFGRHLLAEHNEITKE